MGGVYETSPPFIHLECDDLMGFLTRKRDGQVFPTDTTSSKEYRQDYSAKSKDPQPNFGTRAQTSQDIKKITEQSTDRDTKTYDSKVSKQNYKRYKRNTNERIKKQYKKHDKRARKKERKAQKKREKQQQKIEKSEIDKQMNYTKTEAKQEYHADQQSEAEDREIAKTIDGRDGDLG